MESKVKVQGYTPIHHPLFLEGSNAMNTGSMVPVTMGGIKGDGTTGEIDRIGRGGTEICKVPGRYPFNATVPRVRLPLVLMAMRPPPPGV